MLNYYFLVSFTTFVSLSLFIMSMMSVPVFYEHCVLSSYLSIPFFLSAPFYFPLLSLPSVCFPWKECAKRGEKTKRERERREKKKREEEGKRIEKGSESGYFPGGYCCYKINRPFKNRFPSVY